MGTLKSYDPERSYLKQGESDLHCRQDAVGKTEMVHTYEEVHEVDYSSR